MRINECGDIYHERLILETINQCTLVLEGLDVKDGLVSIILTLSNVIVANHNDSEIGGVLDHVQNLLTKSVADLQARKNGGEI